MSIWNSEPIDVAAINSFESRSMSGFLGIEISRVSHDRLYALMPLDERTRQPYGRLHGGASVALAETVGSIAANLTLDKSQRRAVGMEINANHLRPVTQGFVFAEAYPEALGKTTQVWTIRITDQESNLVCIARMTAAIIPAGRM